MGQLHIFSPTLYQKSTSLCLSYTLTSAFPPFLGSERFCRPAILVPSRQSAISLLRSAQGSHDSAQGLCYWEKDRRLGKAPKAPKAPPSRCRTNVMYRILSRHCDPTTGMNRFGWRTQSHRNLHHGNMSYLSSPDRYVFLLFAIQAG